MYKKYMNQYFKPNRWNNLTGDKKGMDNPYVRSYNNSSKDTSYDPDDVWKREHEKELRYAGDSARESVVKGLDYVPKFMKDAPEGTDYGKVQSASVKWNLANDTDNKELQESAFDELTGLLSTVNKEQYLAKARPLQEFVDAKDTFDYKRKNYTTTKNASKEFSVTTYDLQQLLNKNGYTDKFGNPLKEDGIYGAKTEYAHDQMLEAETAKNSTANASKPTPTQTAETNNRTRESLEKYHNVEIASRGSSRRNISSNSVNTEKTKNDKSSFDFDTRLSYNQNYDERVEILQNRLVELGYLDMSDGGWGYYGPKTIEAVNKYKKDKGLGNTGKDAGVVGKDTWSSLGFLYRTEEDVNAGIEIVTISGKQYKDVSKAINSALRRDRGVFEENENDFWWFKAQVGDDGPWNIKRYADKKYTWEETIGSTFPGYDAIMILYGHKVTVEDIGNITYGYLGKAAGISDFALMRGSGLNNFKNHGFTNIEGEERDQSWIEVGIEWYNSTVK